MHTQLPLTNTTQSTAAGCCGGACACGHAAAEQPAGAPAAANEYAVTGMTCTNCVNHVTKAVGAVAGVTGVRIDLVAGGTSTMQVAGDHIDASAVRAAVESAGYQLV